MRLRIAAVFAIAVWVGWGVFIDRPAPNALPACASNGALACSTIDGFPVGTLIQACGGQPDVCGDNAQLARAGLDARHGGHPGIVDEAVYNLDMARVCGSQLCAMSGAYDVFVFGFSDGSHDAIGVRCGVGGCQAVPDY
jgi:hypothetical protein